MRREFLRNIGIVLIAIACSLISLMALFSGALSWVWWNVPYIYVFHGGLNVTGAIWFACVFVYAAKKFMTAHQLNPTGMSSPSPPLRTSLMFRKFPIVTAFCLAGCLSFLLLYVLDEMSTVIYWPIWGFNFGLFVNKIPIYCSFPIAVWTLYYFARDYFHIGKKVVAYMAVMALSYFAMFVVMVPIYGTISYRVIPDPLDRAVVFWTLYIMPKIFWAQIFMSLWKLPADAGISLRSRGV